MFYILKKKKKNHINSIINDKLCHKIQYISVVCTITSVSRSNFSILHIYIVYRKYIKHSFFFFIKQRKWIPNDKMHTQTIWWFQFYNIFFIIWFPPSIYIYRISTHSIEWCNVILGIGRKIFFMYITKFVEWNSILHLYYYTIVSTKH